MRFRFGPFVLDVAARQFLRDGQPVRLTPRAFELLVALVAQRPRSLGKDELRRMLWPDTWVGSTSLAQLVTELRKALGDRTREPRYLRTVFRHGYAFCAEAREEPRPPEASSDAPTGFQVICGERAILLREGENVIGRDPEARIPLPTALASRRHARIMVTGSRAVLEDLGSKNGTQLGGRRVEGATLLSSGDEIGIGGELLVFWSVGFPDSTVTAARSRGGSGTGPR